MSSNNASDSIPPDDDAELSETGELIRRFKAGDPDSLNELLNHHYPLVRRIVRARMGAKLGQYYDDEDFIQNTFLAAVRDIDSIEMRDSASFRGWLARITERQLLGAVRYHKTEKNDWDKELGQPTSPETSSSPGAHRLVEGNEPTPSRPARDQELQELIDRCMGKLSEDEREVILLRHFMQHPWKEIAEKLNRPTEDAARQLRDRAMEHLNEIVGRHRADLPGGYSSA